MFKKKTHKSQKETSFSNLKNGNWVNPNRTPGEGNEKNQLSWYAKKYAKIRERNAVALYIGLAGCLIALSFVGPKLWKSTLQSTKFAAQDRLVMHQWKIEAVKSSVVTHSTQPRTSVAEKAPRPKKVGTLEENPQDLSIVKAKKVSALARLDNPETIIRNVPAELAEIGASLNSSLRLEETSGIFDYSNENFARLEIQGNRQPATLPDGLGSGDESPDIDFDLIESIRKLGTELAVCGSGLDDDDQVDLKFEIKEGRILPSQWNEIQLAGTEAQKCMNGVLSANLEIPANRNTMNVTLKLSRL